MEQRDAKGRFAKGNTIGPRICSGVAAEMQAKSVEARKENRALAEVVRDALAERAPGDASMSKMEYLAVKAITNHATGDITFKDLRDLQKLLGEDVQKIDIKGPLIVPQDELDILSKWSSKE